MLIAALLFFTLGVYETNAHLNLYMNETETKRLLGKDASCILLLDYKCVIYIRSSLFVGNPDV